MPKIKWLPYSKIIDDLQNIRDLPERFVMSMSESIEEKISTGSQAELQQLAIALESFSKKLTSLSPADTYKAVVGELDADSPESAAYILGQLSFAQSFVSQIVDRKVDDEFVNVIHDKRYFNYLQFLLKKDATGSELAEALNEAPETTSRKLKILRELGITDFRKEGTNQINFLTPITRAIIKDKIDNLIENDSQRLSEVYKGIPEYMKNSPSFSSPVQKLHIA